MKNKIILTSLFTSLFTFILLFFYQDNVVIGARINFQTLDGDFKFTAISSKGRDYLMLGKTCSKNYKLENQLTDEVILYRTTSKNYLDIASWCKYKIKPEWQYPLLR